MLFKNNKTIIVKRNQKLEPIKLTEMVSINLYMKPFPKTNE